MRFLTLAAITVALPFFGSPALAQDDPVVATINGIELRLSTLEQAYDRLPEQYRQAPLEAVFEPLLEQMIDGELILEQAEGAGFADQPEIARQLEIARQDVLRRAYVGRAIDAALTEDALQAAYETMKSDPAFSFEEVKARHILVEDEATAVELIGKLDDGGDFAELAKESSTGPSGPNGGDLGYFQKGTMVPEFGDAAFAMEPGTYTTEPVKTQFGFHVILVEDKRLSVPSFEETESGLREQIAEDTVSSLIADLRESAEITKFNMDGSEKAAE